DVARHFMPKETIRKHLDLLALHKFNVFHWHLTDDQGWRIEIKRYPKLTDVGAWRTDSQLGPPTRDPAARRYAGKPHGGFYTQDDARSGRRGGAPELVHHAHGRLAGQARPPPRRLGRDPRGRPRPGGDGDELARRAGWRDRGQGRPRRDHGPAEADVLRSLSI